jgi:hypothetical protein
MIKFLAGCVLAAAAIGCAQTPAATEAASTREAAEVERFMRGYSEAWNRHDHATIARAYYRTGPSVEEQTANLAKTFEDLRAQGYAKSVIHEIKACPKSSTEATAYMKFTRLKTDGQPLGPKDRASAYDLRRFPDAGWRITRLYGADPAKPLTCPEG